MNLADQIRMSGVGVPGSAPAPLQIFGTPVTTATEGVAYAGFTVTSSGGTAPRTYGLAPGSSPLPAGITIDPLSGVVAGTPSADGSFPDIVIRVTDALMATADLLPFGITVNPTGAVAVLFGNSASGQAAGGSLTSTTTVQVNAAANQVLIAAVFIGGSDDVVSVTATGYAGAVAMTKIAGTKSTGLASRNHNCEIWALENPTLGDQLVTVTRSGTNGVRFYVSAVVAYDVDLAASVVDSNAVFQNAPGSPSFSSNLTTTQNDLMVVSAFSGFQFTGADVASPLAPQTAIQNVDPSDYYGGISYRQAGAAGAVAMGATTNNANWRSAIVVSISLKATAHVTVAPTFYADPAGDDNDDGLTALTAVRTLSRIQKFPKQPGKIVRINGFIRNDAPPVSSTDYALSVIESGSASEPVRFETWGSDPPAILGDVLYPTGWTAATLAETNPFFANIEKRDMGAPMEWGQAPFCGGMMLMPAQWAKGVTLTGIHWWNDTATGSAAFYHYTAAEFGGNSDPTKMVSYTGTAPNIVVQIKDPAIGAHYGTNSPVGRGLSYRTGTGGNTNECIEITYYDQATGTIRASGGPGVPATEGYWAIRFHPVDLVMSGQYAYSQNTQELFAAFPTSDERSVMRYNFGVLLQGDYLQMDGVGVGRCSADPGIQQFALLCQGDNGSVSNSTIAQIGIMGSPDSIRVYGEVGPAPGYAFSGSTDWAFTGIRMLEAWGTSGGFRIFGQNINVDGLYIRDAGGTYLYYGGASTGVSSNIDGCEQLGVHGNVATSYQRSFDVTFTKFAAMNAISPITSQNNDPTIRVKSNEYTNGVITGRRSFAGVFDNLYGFRLDGGDYDSLIDHCATWNAPTILTDNAAPNNASNDGMVFQRSSTDAIGITAISCSGVTMADLITTATGGNTIAQWQSIGGATSPPPARCSQITQTPTGTLTDAVWEVMSRNAGGVAGYTGFQLGPDDWNWQIPAYGAARTMVDLHLTTPSQFSGLQQNSSFSSVYGAMPGSTLSLPAGVTDNDEFGLDRGLLRYSAGNLTANKTITVRETNASATNGPTRDTVIAVTIRDPFATFG